MKQRLPSILLLGEASTSEGPAVVTRLYIDGLKKVASEENRCAVWGGNSRHRMRLILGYACLLFDRRSTVVLSGLGYSRGHLRLARFLKRNIIYIMHGYTGIEPGGPPFPKESLAMGAATAIACVSNSFAVRMRRCFPEYAPKIHVLPNPVDFADIPVSGLTERDFRKIVLIGGGRPIKGNLAVCRAVELMNKSLAGGEKPFSVEVYGCSETPVNNDETAEMSSLPCVKIHGTVPHPQILLALSRAGLFVANSDFETFGMALTEALVCGANVLTSPEIGANDALGDALTPCDIISRPATPESLARQMQYILSAGNNARLSAALRLQYNSAEKAAGRLFALADSLTV